MIIEDEWDPDNDNNAYLFEDGFQVDNMNHNDVTPLLDLQKIYSQYMDEIGHYQLCYDLIQHLLTFHGFFEWDEECT